MFNNKMASRSALELENTGMEYVFMTIRDLMGSPTHGFTIENIEKAEERLSELRKFWEGKVPLMDREVIQETTGWAYKPYDITALRQLVVTSEHSEERKLLNFEAQKLINEFNQIIEVAAKKGFNNCEVAALDKEVLFVVCERFRKDGYTVEYYPSSLIVSEGYVEPQHHMTISWYEKKESASQLV